MIVKLSKIKLHDVPHRKVVASYVNVKLVAELDLGDQYNFHTPLGISVLKIYEDMQWLRIEPW